MDQSLIEENKAIALQEYKTFFQDIKKRILSSQLKAAIAVNKELITLYWEIGSKVYQKQKNEGWGSKTIEKLASDLKSDFPKMKGFSLTHGLVCKRIPRFCN